MAKKRKELTAKELTALTNLSRSGSGRDPILSERRARVAALKARGLTNDKIAYQLAEEGFTTAEGTQFSITTIVKDLAAVNDYWLDRSKETIDKQRALQLRDLDALKHEAWQSGKYNVVLRAIEMQMELLGLKQKVQEAQNVRESTLNLKEFKGPLSVQYIDNRFTKLFEAARDRRAQLLESDGAGVEAAPETEAGV
jgi:hypothetical protein